ncbi:response regulator transcription factor [Inconstantimicrobium porci]|uniref:Stage 0 sporulation protein A homolog n=1 Tax=Inconstantimicrobium porci TaxID=2652291 RepID=A0A7X2T1N1_9CLOT|nr:response regulator transcription factor [Inconstantimicrobium porci]MDD6772287.1 response regulator transcription factor [Inconstantimicrobium porci]MSR91410.1 response regulator transcription factor [Inconstantimicrobium porci]
MFNVLIVDDEVEINELIEVYLKSDGYNILKAYNGEDALKIVNEQKVDLIILDVMMPKINGFDVCMKIRKDYNIPIIMVSAKSQDIDKIQGLSLGADDYITKPFNPLELSARVKAQIRRRYYLDRDAKEKDDNVIEIKGISINKEKHKVYLYGEQLKLTPKEYDILLLLCSNPGKVFNAEDIFKSVWKEKYFEANNTVMVHIWRLREKIEEDAKNPKILETVWGVGYKIEN